MRDERAVSTPPDGQRGERTVAVPLHVAVTILRVYVPRNPNKLRAAVPEVVDAVREFTRLVVAAHETGGSDAAR